MSGLDILDGTPVLDIKPYVPEYDQPALITEPSGDSNAEHLKPNCLCETINNNTSNVFSQLSKLDTYSKEPSDNGLYAAKETCKDSGLNNASLERITCSKHYKSDGVSKGQSDLVEKPVELQQVVQSKEGRRVQWKSPVVDSECSPSIEASDILDPTCSFDSRTIIVHPMDCQKPTQENVEESLLTIFDEDSGRSVTGNECTTEEFNSKQHVDYRDLQQSCTATREASYTNLSSKCTTKYISQGYSHSNRNAISKSGSSTSSPPARETTASGTVMTSNTPVCSKHSLLSSQQQFYTGKDTSNIPETRKSNSSNPLPPKEQNWHVANWISNPQVKKLQVRFTERALQQLDGFTADHSDKKELSLEHLENSAQLKASIVDILAADPRSVYRRQKCTDRLYYLTVDKAHVTCWFDEDNSIEVLRVQPCCSI